VHYFLNCTTIKPWHIILTEDHLIWNINFDSVALCLFKNIANNLVNGAVLMYPVIPLGLILYLKTRLIKIMIILKKSDFFKFYDFFLFDV